MALQLTAAGTNILCQIESLAFDEKIDDPATGSFDVPDSVGYALSQYQVIQITDTTSGVVLYTGFIDKVSDQALPGNLGTRIRTVTCTDNRWRAEKRYWTGPEFNGWMAGDVVAEMHRAVLAGEGLLAAYAMRHDNSAATFGAGVLTNTTTNAAGALTLAASGATFVDTDSTTATLRTGTLTNIVAANNTLTIQGYNAIKFQGEAVAQLGLTNNLYVYRKIWAGSYTLVAGDEFYYDVWVSSTSPQIMMGADLLFTDGTWYSAYTTDVQDQNGIMLNPALDMKGWEDDQWYHRKITVVATEAGKVVAGVYLTIQGKTAGTYTAYYKNVKITATGNGTVRVNAFTGSSMQSNVPASNNGYANVTASVVTAYEAQGQRFTAAQSIASVGIVKGSVIDWVEVDQVQPQSSGSTNYQPQVIVDMSMDGGATYQSCTNHSPLPLIVGMNTAGVSLIFRETLNVGGPDPELSPQFTRIAYAVYSAAACTKTDFLDADVTQTDLGAGTLTNCTAYTDGVKTTGSYRSWDNLSIASQSVFGNGAPVQGTYQQAFSMRSDPSTFVSSQFVFAGNWQNFIAELDVAADKLAASEAGLYYRTTSWTNVDNQYGYAAMITSAAVILRRASNGGTPGQTLIATTPLNFSDATFYRMKVAVTGSTHKIFINDVLYITVTDATWSATGGVGVRWYNGTVGSRESAYFNNFGIVGYESDFISVSIRVTPSLALSGIVGDSRVFWTAVTFSTSTLLVESTIDGGTTWQTCTNWQPIPLLVPGYNAAGKSLKFRFTFTNQAINLPAILQGYSAWVTGAYSATGTRVSPVLAADNAGTIGSSSVTWVASTPTGTGVALASSLNNSTYTSVPSSGNPVNGLTAQGTLAADDFDVNDAANYTATFWAGGVLPVFTIDTAHSRMSVTSGSSGIILWNTAQFPTAKDVSLETITNQSEQGGLVWRYTDVNNLYYLTLADASAGSVPNTVTVRKRVASADSAVTAPTSLPGGFIRGTYHTLKVTMVGTTITVYFDGVVVNTVVDASLTAAGQVGVRQNSGVSSFWYSLRALALGASAVGVTVYSKATLTTTDPTVYPVLSQLVVSVRGPTIMTGAMISATQYAYTLNCAKAILDVAGKSKMYFRVDKALNIIMKDRAYSSAPWPLYSADPLYLGTSNPPTLVRASPAYRNKQYVTGAFSLQTIPENKIGDGSTQSWALAYPVETLSSVSINGDPRTVGVAGIDTGRDFYYQQGHVSLSSDPTLFVEPEAVIAISYIGQVPYTATAQSATQITALSAIDSTSGIVEASEDCGGLPSAQADLIAQARIDANAVLSSDWSYSTMRGGLAPGNLQSVWVPEHGLVDFDVLITAIHTSVWADVTGALQYTYDVTTTSGPNVGTWQRIFALA